MLFSKADNSQPSIIKLVIVGIFDTGFSELDSKFIFGDINQIRRVSKWDNDKISSLEIKLNDYKLLDDISNYIYLNSPSEYDVVTIK